MLANLVLVVNMRNKVDTNPFQCQLMKTELKDMESEEATKPRSILKKKCHLRRGEHYLSFQK